MPEGCAEIGGLLIRACADAVRRAFAGGRDVGIHLAEQALHHAHGRVVLGAEHQTLAEVLQDRIGGLLAAHRLMNIKN